MQKHLSLKHGVLTLLLMLGSCVGLYAQQEQWVTLNLKNVSLKEIFRAIEEQSTYRFSYRNNVVDDRADITVSKKNVAVSTVLTDVLPARGLDYEIVSSKSIVVFQRRASTGKRGEKKTVKGVVKDEQGIPVIGTSVKESGTSNGTVTDLDGNFSLSVAEDAILDVTYIGYAAQHVNTSGKSVLDIQMAEDAEQLQEVVVTGYMAEKKAWNRYETTGVYDCGIPALTVLNDNSEDRSSNYFIEDGSYIKLKTLTLGYSLPESVTRKMSLSRARVSFQAQNLFTLTRYLGADPEGLGYTYPLPRTFTFGLSLGI